MSRAGYVPVERALLEHLPRLSPLVVKVYLGLLLLSRGSGPEKGLVRASVADLSSDLGVRRPSLSSAIGQLEEMGWIEARRAANQHVVSEFRIFKPAQSAQDETVSGSVSSKASAQHESVPATVSSTASTGKKTIDLRPPKREEDIHTLPGGWERLFDSWWACYPRRVSKADARGAFRRVVVDGKTDRDRQADLSLLPDFPHRYERLMTGTKRWTAAEFSKRESKLVPYPATFVRRLDWVTPPIEADAGPRLRRSWE